MHPLVPLKVIASAATTKGLITATVVLLVIRSHLTNFEKAIIITVVGATITGIFTVLGAIIAVRLTRPIQADIQDVKKKVGADKRESD